MEDFRLLSTYSFLQTTLPTELNSPSSILAARRLHHLFIIINKYLSRTTAYVALLSFPQQHTVRESWEYPAFERTML